MAVADQIITGASVAVAGIAVVYSRWQTIATKDQLKLAEKIRKESNEPFVVVDIQPSSYAGGFLYLIIENVGPTMARNVRIKFDPPLESSREADLGDGVSGNFQTARMFTHGIPMMPPKRRIELLFDFAPDRIEQNLASFYKVEVRSDGPGGHVEVLNYEIDLELMYGWRLHQPKTVHDGVKVLEKVSKMLEKFLNAPDQR